MFYTYILKSEKDESFYIGASADLKERIKHHNQRSSKYTSSKAPYVLIWYCAFPTKALAYAFEKYLKSGSGIAFRNKHLLP